jgi:hypothetical protein
LLLSTVILMSSSPIVAAEEVVFCWADIVVGDDGGTEVVSGWQSGKIVWY